jgi:uncharacterized protein (DUF302 family)
MKQYAILKKLLLSLLITTFAFSADYIIKPSHMSVDETAHAIQEALEKSGFTIFGVIDHGLNARSVKMKLNDSKLIIFGNPKGGSMIMQKDIKAGYDLPLKILVYEENHRTYLFYKSPFLLSKEYHLGNCKVVDLITRSLNKITDSTLK